MTTATGRKGAGVFLLGAAVFFVVLVAGPAAGTGIDFLVPGVALEAVDFRAGTSVVYLVISEAHGVRDTSLVGLEITRADSLGVGLEIVSSGWPREPEETIAVSLTLCPGVRGVRSSEEFHDCIGEIRLRQGSGPLREPSSEEIEDFDLERLFLKRREGIRREELAPEQVSVPAGTFPCAVVEYFHSDRRRVSIGGVTAERLEEERSTLRLSPQVPLWGLVSSRVERTSSTAGTQDARPWTTRPRVTVTESVLVEFKVCAE